MKTVFSNQMTIHIWAQQSQDHGRSGHGSLSFDGPTLKSYGTPIANFVEHEGRMACLITTRTYSTTTSGKHMPSDSDISGAAVFHVLYVGVDGYRSPSLPENYHAANILALAEQYAQGMIRVSRAKIHAEAHYRDLLELRTMAHEYAHFFGLFMGEFDNQFPQPSQEAIAAAKERAKQDAAANAASNHEEAQKQLAQFLAATIDELPYAFWRKADKKQIALANDRYIARWRNGGTTRPPNSTPVLLCIRGDVVETTRGAEIPVAHAKRIWPLVQQAYISKTTWTRHDSQQGAIGHFHVDSIEADGTLTAGCHVIPYAELAQIAAQLGLAS